MIARLTLGALVASAALIAGCQSTPAQFFGFTSGSSGSRMTTTSSASGSTLEPRLGTSIYRYLDTSSADIYLTDLPVSRLADLGDPLSDLNGSVIHIHLFLIPAAGSTPIDSTACSAAVRQFVITGGVPEAGGDDRIPASVGIYAGGAFVTPFGSGPGRQFLAGTVEGGTIRLIQADAGFADRLGPSKIEGDFTAKLDDPAARAIADRLAQLAAKTPMHAPPPDPAMAAAIEQTRTLRPAKAE